MDQIYVCNACAFVLFSLTIQKTEIYPSLILTDMILKAKPEGDINTDIDIDSN